MFNFWKTKNESNNILYNIDENTYTMVKVFEEENKNLL